MTIILFFISSLFAVEVNIQETVKVPINVIKDSLRDYPNKVGKDDIREVKVLGDDLNDFIIWLSVGEGVKSSKYFSRIETTENNDIVEITGRCLSDKEAKKIKSKGIPHKPKAQIKFTWTLKKISPTVTEVTYNAKASLSFMLKFLNPVLKAKLSETAKRNMEELHTLSIPQVVQKKSSDNLSQLPELVSLPKIDSFKSESSSLSIPSSLPSLVSIKSSLSIPESLPSLITPKNSVSSGLSAKLQKFDSDIAHMVEFDEDGMAFIDLSKGASIYRIPSNSTITTEYDSDYDSDASTILPEDGEEVIEMILNF